MSWTQVLLFLHILFAILAFGPPLIVFPLLGAAAQKEPQHANFALRIVHLISSRVTIPLAIVVASLGVILIFASDWNFFANEWLYIAAILFLINLTFSVTVQERVGRRLVELTAGSEGAPPPSGPPPAEVMALGKRARMGGMFLGILFLAILLLMIWKPGACAGPTC